MSAHVRAFGAAVVDMDIHLVTHFLWIPKTFTPAPAPHS